jgi:hypothetical protein
MASHDFSAIRAALRLALHQWWDQHVPVVFASLVLVETLLWAFPAARRWAPTLLSLASFPLLGSLFSLRWTRAPRPAAALAWANLYNPLLFPHSGQILWLDGLAVLLAWWGHGWPESLPAIRWRRRPVEEAMNGATLLGAAMMLSAITRLFLPASVWEWIDPLTPAPTMLSTPPTFLAALAANGLVFVLPLVILGRRRRLATMAIVGPRLSLAVLMLIVTGWR